MLCLSKACEWLLHMLPREGRCIPYKPVSVYFLEKAGFHLLKAWRVAAITITVNRDRIQIKLIIVKKNNCTKYF